MAARSSDGAPDQPFRVLVYPGAPFVADLHAHLATTEVIGLLGTPQALVTRDGTLPLDDWVGVSLGGGFGVAEESTASLPLDQGGGELYVVVFPTQAPPRVFDVRTYGPQTPGRSAGLLPDRDPGAWTDGLLPPRGAPNAAARFGL